MALTDLENNVLETFCEDILRQKDRVKSINTDITDAFKEFAKENDINIKSLKKAYKNYEENEKNSAEFIEVDTEADALTRKLIKQYQETEVSEAE